MSWHGKNGGLGSGSLPVSGLGNTVRLGSSLGPECGNDMRNWTDNDFTTGILRNQSL